MVSLPPGSRLGRYQIVEQIGRGGMASVFRAYDPELNRQVAVKVLPSFQAEDPNFVARFRQEAQAVAMLNHPNIIQVYDFGQDKGFTYTVMEHVTGGTLLHRLKGRLSIREVLDWVSPLARALAYGHGEGVIHRDIKPANVLIDANGSPKLADFGLARLLEGSGGLTGKGTVLGTPEYMAPEQALGRPADQKSDLYSLAVIIYQMLVGKVPFRGETPTETLMAHIHQPVPIPTDSDQQIDPRLEAVLVRALSKEPDDRYPGAAELVVALESTLAGEGSEPGLDAEATAVERVVQRTVAERLAGKRLSLGLVLILLIVATALAGTAGAVVLTLYGSGEEGDLGPEAPGDVTEAVVQAQGPRAGPGDIGAVAVESSSVLGTIFQRVHAIRSLEPLEEVTTRFFVSRVPGSSVRGTRPVRQGDRSTPEPVPSGRLSTGRGRTRRPGLLQLPTRPLEEDLVQQPTGASQQGDPATHRCGGHLP